MTYYFFSYRKISKMKYVKITVFPNFTVFPTFFDSFPSPKEKLLGNSKNDLNKVPTRCNSLPKAYPICGNWTIISTQKNVFRHKKKKKAHIIVKPIHSSLRSESKIIKNIKILNYKIFDITFIFYVVSFLVVID